MPLDEHTQGSPVPPPSEELLSRVYPELRTHSKLKGLKVAQQFAVADPVNPLGLVFSAGIDIKL